MSGPTARRPRARAPAADGNAQRPGRRRGNSVAARREWSASRTLRTRSRAPDRTARPTSANRSSRPAPGRRRRHRGGDSGERGGARMPRCRSTSSLRRRPILVRRILEEIRVDIGAGRSKGHATNACRSCGCREPACASRPSLVLARVERAGVDECASSISDSSDGTAGVRGPGVLPTMTSSPPPTCICSSSGAVGTDEDPTQLVDCQADVVELVDGEAGSLRHVARHEPRDADVHGVGRNAELDDGMTRIHNWPLAAHLRFRAGCEHGATPPLPIREAYPTDPAHTCSGFRTFIARRGRVRRPEALTGRRGCRRKTRNVAARAPPAPRKPPKFPQPPGPRPRRPHRQRRARHLDFGLLQKELKELLDGGTQRVEVDLSGVVFMDSSALSALVGAHDRARSTACTSSW